MEVKLETVHTGYSVSKINANFERIQHFINYYCVKRYNDKGDANEMWTDIIFDPLVDGGGGGGGGGGGSVCTTIADIMLVVDNTGSQLKAEYDTFIKPAITNMVDNWISLNRDIRAGLMRIRLDVTTPDLLLTSSLSSVNSAILAMPEPSLGTNISVAIDAAAEELVTNGRIGVPKVMLIITDGTPNTPSIPLAISQGISSAEDARASGIRIVVFGVTGVDLSGQVGGGVG